jgi:hypothetical protein
MLVLLELGRGILGGIGLCRYCQRAGEGGSVQPIENRVDDERFDRL